MVKLPISILLFVALISGCNSVSQSNPLIGVWARDTEKTADELARSDSKHLEEYQLVNEAIHCEETGSCLRTILEYTESKVITHLYDESGTRISRESANYQLINVNGKSIIATEYPAQNIIEEVPLVTKHNQLCFELSYRGFTWREYWRRHKAPINGLN